MNSSQYLRMTKTISVLILLCCYSVSFLNQYNSIGPLVVKAFVIHPTTKASSYCNYYDQQSCILSSKVREATSTQISFARSSSGSSSNNSNNNRSSQSKSNKNDNNKQQQQPFMAATSTTTPTSQKRNQKRMIETINEPMKTTVGDADQQEQQSNDDDMNYQLVECIIKAADGRKANNIVALKVRHISTVSSYIILLTGNSRPQNQAIASAIRSDIKDQYNGHIATVGNGVPEGSAESGWILLDYGSVIVHIMTPKSRLYYNIENQWKEKGATMIDITHLLMPNAPIMEGNNNEDDYDDETNMFSRNNNNLGRFSSNFENDEETDPFWS